MLLVIRSKKKPKDVSIDDFTSETQFTSEQTDQVDLIWWIPKEYWEVIFANDETVSNEESKAIVDLLQNYLVLMVVKGKVGIFGGVTYDSKEHMKAITKVIYKTVPLEMVNQNTVNPDLLNFLSMIQPMMKNMLGSMGENMQFFLFGSPKKNNVLPVDPYSNEVVIFELGDFKKEVQLPLGCLLEEKKCPTDDKLHSGKWKYCPYHGDELTTI